MDIPAEEERELIDIFLNVAAKKGDKTAAVLQKSLALQKKS